MTFADWFRDTRRRIQTDGLAGVYESSYQLYLGGLRRVDGLYEYGIPVFERDWDVLVILDACRADMMAEVGREYGFDGETVYSNASYSKSWMERNFGPEYDAEKRRTAYVTGNPFSSEAVGPDEFAHLREVWRHSWDEDVGTIRARPITDHAIRVWRDHSPDRMIIHYMQPHGPFVPAPEVASGFGGADTFAGRDEKGIWERVRHGEIDERTVKEAYYDNLRYLLDELSETLLKNLEADRVVLTADHGNALGEWGIWGHPPNVPLPAIRKVPWYVTSGTDTGTHDPDPPTDVRETDDGTVEERLRNLGYM